MDLIFGSHACELQSVSCFLFGILRRIIFFILQTKEINKINQQSNTQDFITVEWVGGGKDGGG